MISVAHREKEQTERLTAETLRLLAMQCVTTKTTTPLLNMFTSFHNMSWAHGQKLEKAWDHEGGAALQQTVNLMFHFGKAAIETETLNFSQKDYIKNTVAYWERFMGWYNQPFRKFENIKLG